VSKNEIGPFQLNKKVIDMEIKIDTKKDSPDDIKKTIEFLKTLVGMSNSMNSSGSSDFNASTDAASGMIGLFGDAPVLNNDTKKSGEGDESEEEETEKIELIPY
jgi:hypothetical protein